MKFKPFTAASHITIDSESLRESVRKMDWLNYVVDPEWARFCKFGPEDIGGPFEKLGIIRRIDRVDTVFMSAQMAAEVNRIAEQNILGASLHGFGLNVVTVPGIPDNTAYMFKSPVLNLHPTHLCKLIGFNDL